MILDVIMASNSSPELLSHINKYLRTGMPEDLYALQDLVSEGSFEAKGLVERVKGVSQASTPSEPEDRMSDNKNEPIEEEDMKKERYISQCAELFATDLEAVRADPAFLGSDAHMANLRDVLACGSDSDLIK